MKDINKSSNAKKESIKNFCESSINSNISIKSSNLTKRKRYIARENTTICEDKDIIKINDVSSKNTLINLKDKSIKIVNNINLSLNLNNSKDDEDNSKIVRY